VLSIVACTEVDESDLLTGDLQSVLLIKLAFSGNFIELFAHRTNSMTSIKSHFDCFLIADVALTNISHDKNPRVTRITILIY